MSELGAKQEIFARLSNKHETWMYTRPYIEIRGGEWLRTQAQADWNASHCRACKGPEDEHDAAIGHTFKAIGIKRSLHILKLAKDYNVFRRGIWLNKTEYLEWMGKHWESLSGTYRGIKIECCWGGRFRKPDGNHISIAHGGRK